MPKDPMLVGVFGIDGSGKTTHINLLRSYLIRKNYWVERPILKSSYREEAHRIAWELGKKNAYEVFDLNTLTLLGAFDVLYYIQGYVWNSVQKRVLIFDKYVDAFKAVAISHGLTDFSQIDLVFDRFPKLDLQFYLKIDVNVSLDRILNREGGAYENEAEEYLINFKKAYDELLIDQPDVVVIDANQSLEDIQIIMVDSIEKRLGVIG